MKGFKSAGEIIGMRKILREDCKENEEDEIKIEKGVWNKRK